MNSWPSAAATQSPIAFGNRPLLHLQRISSKI
jgi:hypothetical protein